MVYQSIKVQLLEVIKMSQKENVVMLPKQLTDASKASERSLKYLDMIKMSGNYLGTQRAKLVTESYKETESLPNCIRRAKAMEKVLLNMDISIEPLTRIVGSQTEFGIGKNAPLFPEIYSSKMAQLELVNGEPNFPWEKPVERWLAEDPESFKKEMRDILEYWSGKTVADHIYPLFSPEAFKAHSFDGVFVFTKDWYFNYGDGHFIPDYPYLLNNGVKENIKKCKEKISNLDSSLPESIEQRSFWQAVIISNEAVIKFARRYSELAEEMALTEQDESRKNELFKIANICAWVPENPPRDFHEAIQMMYFIHLAIHIEDAGHSVSYGRADQYLWPFYNKDLGAGRITPEYARELIENLYMKTWQIGKWRCEADSKCLRGKPGFENLTIGGQNADGQDVTNELTYLFLDAKYNIRLNDPQLTARWHPNAPTKYKLECCRLIQLGIGQPAVFNDPCVISAMMHGGYSLEDAYDYGIVGCTEPNPAGLSSGSAGGPQFNMAKVVELTLYGGNDLRTGIFLHPNSNGKDLSNFESYDELWSAFLDQLNYYHRLENEVQNAGEIVFEKLLDEPISSSFGGPRFTIERGKGFKSGGGKYHWNGDNVGAIGTAGNSLAAVKWLVFDKKLLTGLQLKHALETNFEDQTTSPTGEEIRRMCIKAPKFGNDDDYVDFITRDVLKEHCNRLLKYKTTTYGRGPIGCFISPASNSANSNVAWAPTLGATPDGRKAWESPSETTSPAQGELGPRKGITACINSVAKYVNQIVPGGQLINYKLAPEDVDGEEGLWRLVNLIDACFNKMCFHMQFNVINAETLRDAQKNPEKYQDLIVRVAGFSAPFVELDKDVQDDIINRVTLRF